MTGIRDVYIVTFYQFSHGLSFQRAINNVRASVPADRRGDDGDGHGAVGSEGGHQDARKRLHLREETTQQSQLPVARARAVRRRLPQAQLGHNVLGNHFQVW